VPSGRTRTQQEIFSCVQALLGVRREHEALRAGRMWHLASDEWSYVFLRESEEEQVAVAFNNSDKARELRIPLKERRQKRWPGFRYCSGRPGRG